jgi:hypothetical protein
MATVTAKRGPLSESSADYGLVLPSQRAPYMKKLKNNFQTRKLKSGHDPKGVQDAKMDWPTDLRS